MCEKKQDTAKGVDVLAGFWTLSVDPWEHKMDIGNLLRFDS